MQTVTTSTVATYYKVQQKSFLVLLTFLSSLYFVLFWLVKMKLMCVLNVECAVVLR